MIRRARPLRRRWIPLPRRPALRTAPPRMRMRPCRWISLLLPRRPAPPRPRLVPRQLRRARPLRRRWIPLLLPRRPALRTAPENAAATVPAPASPAPATPVDLPTATRATGAVVDAPEAAAVAEPAPASPVPAASVDAPELPMSSAWSPTLEAVCHLPLNKLQQHRRRRIAICSPGWSITRPHCSPVSSTATPDGGDLC